MCVGTERRVWVSAGRGMCVNAEKATLWAVGQFGLNSELCRLAWYGGCVFLLMAAIVVGVIQMC